MKIKRILSGAAASVALLATQGAQAETSNTTLSLSRQDGCSFLTYRDCTGKTDALEFKTPSGTGSITFRVEQFEDTSDRTDLYRRKVFGKYGEAGLSVDSTTHLKGMSAILDKSFKPSEQIWVNYGVRFGKVQGEAGIDAKAWVTLNPLTITIPAVSAHGYSYAGTTITTPRYSVEDGHGDFKQRASLYGDLHQSAGFTISVTPRTQLAFSQAAQIGVVSKVGLCGEMMFTSQSASSNGICRGSFLESSAKYAATVGFRVSETKKDMLYDQLYKSAGRRAENINGRLAPVRSYADTLYDKTGYRADVPSYTADDVMNFFGLESPYRVSQSVVVGLSARFDSASVSLTYVQPLKGLSSDKSSLNLAVNYQFR